MKPDHGPSPDGIVAAPSDRDGHRKDAQFGGEQGKDTHSGEQGQGGIGQRQPRKLWDYPRDATARSSSTGETAHQAADAMNMSGLNKSLQERSLAALEDGAKTPEEIRAIISADLGRPVLLTSVRPRLSQLKRLGKVRDSGLRGLAEGGRCKAIKWELVPQPVGLGAPHG